MRERGLLAVPRALSWPTHLFGVGVWTRLTTTAAVSATVSTALLGGTGPLAVLVVGGIACIALARALATPADRSFLLRLVLLSLAGRALLALGVHLVLVDRGTGGALFLDDGGYTLNAQTLSRSWRGIPPTPNEAAMLVDPSISALFITLTAAVFRVAGESMLVMKVVNSVIGIAQAVLVYRTMRNLQLPGAKLAALLVALFPSLVLWSILVLKDTLAVTLMLIAVWGVSEIQRGSRVWPWIATVASLLVLRDLRVYAFVILAVAWPIGLFVATRGARKRASLVALTLSLLLLLTSSKALEMLTPGTLDAAAFTRSAMAEGARSGFVEPPPVAQAPPGTAFVVHAPGRTPVPDALRRLHEVPAGTQLVIEGTSTPAPIPGARRDFLVMVSPGDIVWVVAGLLEPRSTLLALAATRTPAPVQGSAVPSPVPGSDGGPAQPTFAADTAVALMLQPGVVSVLSTPGPSPAIVGTDKFTIQTGIWENLRHLPIGVLFLIGAPFPLAARTAAELAFTPEMLLWYVVVAFALLGLFYMIRQRNVASAHSVLVVLGLGLALSLIEGNVGTLVRHRAMIIPAAVMLAAAGVYWYVPLRSHRLTTRLLTRLR